MVSSLIFVFGALLASSIPTTEAFVQWPVKLPEFKTPNFLPKCVYSDKIASCCATVANSTQNQLCATFKINLNDLSVNASLSFNDRILAQKRVEVGKICVPVGGTPVLACLQFYWVEIGVGDSPEDFHSNICFQGSVSRLATVDFQCLRFDDGKFSRNADHQPSSKGWLNFNLGK